MLEKIFHLKEENTSVSKEFIAALTTFMAMSYVIFVIPSILSQTGMEYNAVYGATILATALGTFIVGFFSNVPYAQSAGIGIASLITYTICGTLGFTWNEALAMVFICSIINILITLTSLRKKIIKSIPVFFQEAITVGIGLFISYIGLINSGIIVFGASSIQSGIALDVVPKFADINSNSLVLALIGLIITSILVAKKVKGSYLIGIIITTIIGIPLGVTHSPDFTNYSIVPSISSTFLKLDFGGLFSDNTRYLTIFMTIFSLCISDLFDTIGVFIGTGKKAGIFKIDKDGKMPKKLEKAMITDSMGTLISSILGTSNVTTYVESSAGIEAGGRTGLTSIFVSLFFLLSLFVAPFIACVPMVAVSPVLILIGVSCLENIGSINFHSMKIAIPAFFIIVMMPFAYSITTGIEFGFIFYIIINLFMPREDRDKISPIIYFFAILFIIKNLYHF